jgi:hypothetical protein
MKLDDLSVQESASTKTVSEMRSDLWLLTYRDAIIAYHKPRTALDIIRWNTADSTSCLTKKGGSRIRRLVSDQTVSPNHLIS